MTNTNVNDVIVYKQLVTSTGKLIVNAVNKVLLGAVNIPEDPEQPYVNIAKTNKAKTANV